VSNKNLILSAGFSTEYSVRVISGLAVLLGRVPDTITRYSVTWAVGSGNIEYLPDINSVHVNHCSPSVGVIDFLKKLEKDHEVTVYNAQLVSQH
jgi:hypothetical protein